MHVLTYSIATAKFESVPISDLLSYLLGVTVKAHLFGVPPSHTGPGTSCYFSKAQMIKAIMLDTGLSLRKAKILLDQNWDHFKTS